MKWLLVTLIFLCHIEGLYAANINVKTAFNSKSISSTNKSTSEEGKLISRANMHYGLGAEFSMNQNWRIVLSHLDKKYDFDNTDEVISENEKLQLLDTSMGIKWIPINSMSFELNFHVSEDIGFEIDSGTSKAILFKDSFNYISAHYHQIVLLWPRLFFGLKLGVESSASAARLKNRQSTRYGLFGTLNMDRAGQIETFFEIQQITKEDDSLTYSDRESNIHLVWTFYL